MWFVSPTYQPYYNGEKPYQKNGRSYVTINYKGKDKEVRCYDAWQASWSKDKMPRVERRDDMFLVYGYPDGAFARIAGIMTDTDGRRGIWKYSKNPPNPFKYNWKDNIMWSPLWGWFGTVDKEPVYECEPFFISENDLKVEGGWKRLTSSRNCSEEMDWSLDKI